VPESALYATIHAQPDVIQQALADCDLLARQAARSLVTAPRIFLCGTGTNSHAAVVGEHLLRSAGLDAWATTSFDFVTYPRPLLPDDVVIVLSQTGETQYGGRAIKRAHEARAQVIGLTAQESSMPSVELRLPVSPRERSDTYTASYTATVAVLALVAEHAAQLRSMDTVPLREALRRLPDMVQSLLEHESDLQPAVERLHTARRVVLAGAGPNAVTAREGALKIKESSYLIAEGFELETLLHGGLQAVESGDLAVLIAAWGPALDRTLDAARALDIIGASLLVVADERAMKRLPSDVNAQIVTFAALPEPLSPALAVVPLQLLAALTADRLGTNPDNFRFDDPPYRRAIESLTL
jgi:glutamine---fructose-6-phosphate transaminase (isomerizing)